MAQLNLDQNDFGGALSSKHKSNDAEDTDGIQLSIADNKESDMTDNTTANTDGSLHTEITSLEGPKKTEDCQAALFSASPILLTESGDIIGSLERCVPKEDAENKAGPVLLESTEVEMPRKDVPQCSLGISFDHDNEDYGAAASMHCATETVYPHPRIVSVQDKEGSVVDNCILDRGEGSCSEKHMSPGSAVVCYNSKGEQIPSLLHNAQVSFACHDRQEQSPESVSANNSFRSYGQEQAHILPNSISEHQTSNYTKEPHLFSKDANMQAVSPSITSSQPVNTDSSQTQVKLEPQDDGYEDAFRGSSQTNQCNKIARTANTSNSEGATTSFIWRGKKRVRVTVIKGEWRRPKAKLSVNRGGNTTAANTNVSSNSNRAVNSWNKTARSSKGDGGLGIVVKTEPQDTQNLVGKISESASTEPTLVVEPLPATGSSSSAVPIALFRNAYVKLEPVSSDSLETRPGASISRQPENISSSSSSVDSRFSQGAGHNSRGRRRERPNSSSSVTEPSQTQRKKRKLEIPEIRSCAVKLKPLPSDILATGIVNLKSNPKILLDAAMLTTSVGLRKQPLDVKRPWVCDQCGKSYKTKSARTQHFKVHTGIREHICSMCGADFMYKSVLTSHYRFVHEGEKPHVCQECGKAFAWSSHLRIHINRHYEEKSHTCSICHKNFSSHYIKKHMESHSDFRPFNCQICGTNFKTKLAVEVHGRVHTGYKPFSCDKCGQTFPYSSSLRIHKRTHTGERPFPCRLCTSTFTQSTHLRTHMKGVHKTDNLPSYKRCITVKRMRAGTGPAVFKKDGIYLMRKAMGKVLTKTKLKAVTSLDLKKTQRGDDGKDRGKKTVKKLASASKTSTKTPVHTRNSAVSRNQKKRKERSGYSGTSDTCFVEIDESNEEDSE